MAFRFEHLETWKDSILYAKSIYSVTKTFPRDEIFALTNQLRRAASSISTNIAEGAGGSSKKDFRHFLDIAVKSCYETVSLMFLAMELEYISNDKRIVEYEKADILVKKITSLRNTLR